MTIQLPRKIDNQLAANIEKESVYVSPHLKRLQVTPDRKAVQFESTGKRHKDEVENKVKRFLGAMLQNIYSFDTKIHMSTARSDKECLTENIHQELQKRGWLYDYGGGQVALTGPAMALAGVLDELAGALYRKHFNTTTGMYPALVTAELLDRCGYFESHPNSATFVGHVINDFDVIEEFRQANAGEDKIQMPPHEHIHLPGMCLNPAACFPCYPTLAEQTIEKEGKVITWLGRVFRYESHNIAGLNRLWEFNVRELVFIGGEQFVTDARQLAISIVGELCELLDLTCSVESATDPFFSAVSAAKTFWQQTQEVKYEIRLPVAVNPDGTFNTIAAGSINLHGTFFGERFNISSHDTTVANSGCVGLGIERWVLSAFAQHGFDPARWPESLRSDVFGE